MKMRENLDLDKIAHKLMTGGTLNAEEVLATAGPELVQRCTGIKRVPKIPKSNSVLRKTWRQKLTESIATKQIGKYTQQPVLRA